MGSTARIVLHHSRLQRLEVVCGGDTEQLADQRIYLRQEFHNAPAVPGQEIEFLLEQGDMGKLVEDAQ